MNITLRLYGGEDNLAVPLIQGFWHSHNGCMPDAEDAAADLAQWTREGHRLYFILLEDTVAGFVHLGSRGAEIDWLEDLYVSPEYRRKGIGSRAIALVEKIVMEYSESLYIEAAARNEQAIRLYHRLGYDCLNTITIRKDFRPEDHTLVRREQIQGLPFSVKKYICE